MSSRPSVVCSRDSSASEVIIVDSAPSTVGVPGLRSGRQRATIGPAGSRSGWIRAGSSASTPRPATSWMSPAIQGTMQHRRCHGAELVPALRLAGGDHRQVVELRADLREHGRDRLGGHPAHHAWRPSRASGPSAWSTNDCAADRGLPTGERARQDPVGDDGAERHPTIRRAPGPGTGPRGSVPSRASSRRRTRCAGRRAAPRPPGPAGRTPTPSPGTARRSRRCPGGTANRGRDRRLGRTASTPR